MSDFQLTPSLPESNMKTFNVLLTFKYVDKILWCDHSNETFSAILLHGTIYLFFLQCITNEFWDYS